MEITHVIPQVGFQIIPLYPPSDHYFKRLRTHREIRRMRALRQLGSLTYALPGARQSRWDYTAAMLYYSTLLDLQGFSANFRIGKIEFSSMISAIQTAAVIWNIGHLPGTYAVEKGVYRFLASKNKSAPADTLSWPHYTEPEIKEIVTQANHVLISDDYLAMHRVLALFKLCSFANETSDDLFQLTTDFVAPLILGFDRPQSEQWKKLRLAWSLVRHLAYLTLDGPLSGINWAPCIPDLVRHEVSRGENQLSTLSRNISEVLSPIERLTYISLYHRAESRREAAIVAQKVYQHLSTQYNPIKIIKDWLNVGPFGKLGLGRMPSRRNIKRVATIRLRSHFLSPSRTLSELENSLKVKDFQYPIVLKYLAWNSEIVIEPDELIVDVMIQEEPSTKDIGKILAWFHNYFDLKNIKPNDEFAVFQKTELEPAYLELFGRAIEISFPGIRIKFQPWPLQSFGLFPSSPFPECRGGIWCCNATLDEPLIRHILRDRRKHVDRRYIDKYWEVIGLIHLRSTIRAEIGDISRRSKWLVLTGSIRLCNSQRDLMEFDGGLLQISSRYGNLTFYGLESKHGGENAAESLRRRLSELEISVQPISINRDHAYVELKLSKDAYIICSDET